MDGREAAGRPGWGRGRRRVSSGGWFDETRVMAVVINWQDGVTPASTGNWSWTAPVQMEVRWEMMFGGCGVMWGAGDSLVTRLGVN